ncbi:TolC family outer membrane protein [Aquicoccus sp. G2-2]|uniref:TolC family outer membrane protein n=1 Tax=Aquicoccus sp. G2-2 TaxID=3092120 RepID=UPI002AE0631E|nr:TolC family outer membrane protein [Aquicoccus sp. G2-2]MEA1113773.1 TolC family outer membrane protein [Aquicoccus sp. G2-2]
MGIARLKKSLIAAALAGGVAAAGLPAETARAETLADAMASAYQHNGLVDQNRALLRAADEDVAQAVSALKPILNWTGDVTHTFNRGYNTTLGASIESSSTAASLGLAASLLLYDFGTSSLRTEAAKELVLATRETLRSAEQQVILRAAIAYLEVQRNQEFVRLRQNNTRVIGVELRAARDRFDVGEVTRTDVAIAEARLAAARSALAAAQGALASAVEEYNAAVGHRPGKLAPPPRLPNPAKTVKAAKAIGLRDHPSMHEVQHQVAAAELNIAAAKAAMSPTVTLRGTYGLSETFNSRANNNGGTVGINVGGPIYQGGRLSSVVRKAMAQRDSARAGLHQARSTVAQNVGNAWAQLQVARASREASDRQVRASTVAFRGTREEATLGARTTLDVLNAEQELLDARANLISATIDQHEARYRLLAAVGWLTAERLKLNVPKYDPAAYYNMVKTAPAQMSRQGKQLDKVLRALGKQ